MWFVLVLFYVLDCIVCYCLCFWLCVFVLRFLFLSPFDSSQLELNSAKHPGGTPQVHRIPAEAVHQ